MTKIILLDPVLPDAYSRYVRSISKQLGRHDFRFNSDLIAFIESAEKIDSKTIRPEFFEQNKDKLYAFDERPNTYYGWNSDMRAIGSIGVQTYDDRHRHVIGEYDGSEYLIDIDNYICVDEEHNIWEDTNE